MNNDLLMAIDIGTQSTRVALLDTGGSVVASASRLQAMHTPRAGWAEQDPETWKEQIAPQLERITAYETERDLLGRREDQFFGTVFFGSGLLFLAGVFVWVGVEEFVMQTLLDQGAKQNSGRALRGDAAISPRL